MTRETTMTAFPSLATKVAVAFKARAKEQGYKGRKRDRAALEFVLGAWAAHASMSDPSTAGNLPAASFLTSVRGYDGLMEFLPKETDDDTSD